MQFLCNSAHEVALDGFSYQMATISTNPQFIDFLVSMQKIRDHFKNLSTRKWKNTILGEARTDEAGGPLLSEYPLSSRFEQWWRDAGGRSLPTHPIRPGEDIRQDPGQS